MKVVFKASKRETEKETNDPAVEKEAANTHTQRKLTTTKCQEWNGEKPCIQLLVSGMMTDLPI